MSEAGAVTEESFDAPRMKDGTQSGYAGKPLFGVEMRVVSTEDSSQTLRANEEGEILVR